MRVAIYQPQYFPRLHYYNRALDSDCFVLLSSAQFTRDLTHPDGKRHKSYQAHTPVKLPNDGRRLLTVPVHKRRALPISGTPIDYAQAWPRRHLRSLDSGYTRAARYAHIRPAVEGLLLRRYDSLADLDRTTFLWGLSEILGLGLSLNELTLERVNSGLDGSGPHRLRRVLEDHELAVRRPPGPAQGAAWTAAICAELGADEYVQGGIADANYGDAATYERLGIALRRQDWKCAPYPQPFTDAHGFVPNLSILDLVANLDTASARDHLVAERPPT